MGLRKTYGKLFRPICSLNCLSTGQTHYLNMSLIGLLFAKASWHVMTYCRETTCSELFFFKHWFEVFNDAILAGGQTRLKCMGFWPTWKRYNSATKSRINISTAKIYFLKDICTEIIFMKYKGEFQVITTVNEFFFSLLQTLLVNIRQITMKLEATWEVFGRHFYYYYYYY